MKDAPRIRPSAEPPSLEKHLAPKSYPQPGMRRRSILRIAIIALFFVIALVGIVRYRQLNTSRVGTGNGTLTIHPHFMAATPIKAYDALSVVWASAFSGDGRRLAIGGGGVLSLWDVKTGKLVMPVAGDASAPGGMGKRVALNYDGTLLATSDANDTILTVWKGGMQQQTITLPQSADALAFSPDSKVLAVGDHDGPVTLWNVRTGTLLRLIQHAADALAFSPDGTVLATSVCITTDCANGTITLFDAATGAPLGTMLSHARGLGMTVALSADHQLLFGSDADTITIWNAHTHALLVPPLDPDASVASMMIQSIFCTDNNHLLVAGVIGPNVGYQIVDIELKE